MPPSDLWLWLLRTLLVPVWLCTAPTYAAKKTCEAHLPAAPVGPARGRCAAAVAPLAAQREHQLLQVARDLSKKRDVELPQDAWARAADDIGVTASTPSPAAGIWNSSKQRGAVLPRGAAHADSVSNQSAAKPVQSGCGNASKPCQSESLLSGGRGSVGAPGVAAAARANASQMPLEEFTEGWMTGSPLPMKDVVDPSSATFYDHVGLILELHVPGSTLEEITTSHASLAEFLGILHAGLSAAANVSQRQIDILGLFERYQRDSRDGNTLGGEVLVRFEVLPALANDTKSTHATLSPQRIFNRLRQDLASPSSGLRQGSLADVLQNASLSLLPSPTMLDGQEPKTAPGLSTIALPIGISAAFTGVLVWLAAW